MSVRDAVIVSTARTPIGRAYKGAFNATPGATLGALSLAPAIERAGIDAGEIDDVVWGCVLTQGVQAGNIGRQVALRAGCPVTVSAQTIDRQCASGLMAIATGQPARSATWRPILPAWVPWVRTQPQTTSSISPASMPARSIAGASESEPSVAPAVALKAPL